MSSIAVDSYASAPHEQLSYVASRSPSGARSRPVGPRKNHRFFLGQLPTPWKRLLRPSSCSRASKGKSQLLNRSRPLPSSHHRTPVSDRNPNSSPKRPRFLHHRATYQEISNASMLRDKSAYSLSTNTRKWKSNRSISTSCPKQRGVPGCGAKLEGRQTGRGPPRCETVLDKALIAARASSLPAVPGSAGE